MNNAYYYKVLWELNTNVSDLWPLSASSGVHTNIPVHRPPLPHFCVRSCLSHLPTSLAWRAGSAPSLLSLQVFLVADRAHAVGAGVTVETASHGAKHWHLGLIGLLSHAVTEGQGGVGEDIPGKRNDGHVIKNIRGLF